MLQKHTNQEHAMTYVTQMMYVAFVHHVLVVTSILTNVNAKLNANRDKITPARNISCFYMEKANDANMMTSLI